MAAETTLKNKSNSLDCNIEKLTQHVALTNPMKNKSAFQMENIYDISSQNEGHLR